MKYLLIFLFFISFTISCNHNKKKVVKILENEDIKPPPPPRIMDENSLVGFGCYYSGRKSKPVEIMTEILENKKYEELKIKLYSKKSAEKYLSTFACIELSKKNLIHLNEIQLEQIVLNKQSNLKVSFCGGCTESENYNLYELFSEKIDFINQVESWFKEIKK